MTEIKTQKSDGEIYACGIPEDTGSVISMILNIKAPRRAGILYVMRSALTVADLRAVLI